MSVSSDLETAVSKRCTAIRLRRLQEAHERPFVEAVAAGVAPHRLARCGLRHAEGSVGPEGIACLTSDEAGLQLDRALSRTAMGPLKGGSTRFRIALDPLCTMSVLLIIRIA